MTAELIAIIALGGAADPDSAGYEREDERGR